MLKLCKSKLVQALNIYYIKNVLTKNITTINALKMILRHLPDNTKHNESDATKRLTANVKSYGHILKSGRVAIILHRVVHTVHSK